MEIKVFNNVINFSLRGCIVEPIRRINCKQNYKVYLTLRADKILTGYEMEKISDFIETKMSEMS